MPEDGRLVYGVIRRRPRPGQTASIAPRARSLGYAFAGTPKGVFLADSYLPPHEAQSQEYGLPHTPYLPGARAVGGLRIWFPRLAFRCACLGSRRLVVVVWVGAGVSSAGCSTAAYRCESVGFGRLAVECSRPSGLRFGGWYSCWCTFWHQTNSTDRFDFLVVYMIRSEAGKSNRIDPSSTLDVIDDDCGFENPENRLPFLGVTHFEWFILRGDVKIQVWDMSDRHVGWIDHLPKLPCGDVLFIIQNMLAGMKTGRRRLGTTSNISTGDGSFQYSRSLNLPPHFQRERSNTLLDRSAEDLATPPI